MSPARLRPATPLDLPLLVQHRRRMWEDIGDGYSREELDAADFEYHEWLAPRLDDGTLQAVIAEEPDRGAPVASGAVWLQPIQPRPGAPTLQPYVLSMFTEPSHRGRGLGRLVVRALVDWSRERGYRSVVLHAAPGARSVYGAEGFERTWEMRWHGS